MYAYMCACMHAEWDNLYTYAYGLKVVHPKPQRESIFPSAFLTHLDPDGPKTCASSTSQVEQEKVFSSDSQDQASPELKEAQNH